MKSSPFAGSFAPATFSAPDGPAFPPPVARSAASRNTSTGRAGSPSDIVNAAVITGANLVVDRGWSKVLPDAIT